MGITDELPVRLYSNKHLMIAFNKIGSPESIEFGDAYIRWVGGAGSIDIPVMIDEKPEFVMPEAGLKPVDLSAIPLLRIERESRILSANMRALFVYDGIAFTTEGYATTAVSAGGLPNASIPLSYANRLKLIAGLEGSAQAGKSGSMFVVLITGDGYELAMSFPEYAMSPDAFGSAVHKYLNEYQQNENVVIDNQGEAAKAVSTVGSVTERIVQVAAGDHGILFIGDGISIRVSGTIRRDPFNISKTSASWIINSRGGSLAMNVKDRYLVGQDSSGRYVISAIVYA